MSAISSIFTAVRPSIVALGSRFARANPDAAPIFPDILGTGFVVDSRGLIVTNRHVAQALLDLPRHPETGQSAAMAVLFDDVRQVEGQDVLGLSMLDIKHYMLLTEFTWTAEYYGDPLPDIALLQLNAQNLPALELVTEPGSWEVGAQITTLGYAMGREAMVIYNRINQVTPFLRSGIISSVFPFPMSKPHGFTIDSMSQGGQSGSPILRTDAPKVLGLLHAGFDGTNITLAVPSHIVAAAVAKMLELNQFHFDGVPTIQELRTRASGRRDFSWDKVQLWVQPGR